MSLRFEGITARDRSTGVGGGRWEQGVGRWSGYFSTAPVSSVKLLLSSLQTFPLSRFNKLPEPDLLFKNLWKMYVKVKRVHCAEKGSSL